MAGQSDTPRTLDTPELERELRATLDARRELGTGYDQQFIQRLAEQLTTQVRQEIANAPKPHANRLSADHRTGIAICSLIFGIPLVAIASGNGLVGMSIAFVALVLINLVAGLA
jgi:hypothetical protein